MKELQETAAAMVSEDYQERFKAEYYQLKIRIEKLEKMMDNWAKGTLSFTPTCPSATYELQLRFMKDYLRILDMRATMEHVNL